MVDCLRFDGFRHVVILLHGQFPGAPVEISPETIDYVAQQLGLLDLSDSRLTDLANRTGKRHRAEIRIFFGSREATVAFGSMLSELLQRRFCTGIFAGLSKAMQLQLDALRQAIGIIANGTMRARNPLSWGHGNAACASYSKHFGA